MAIPDFEEKIRLLTVQERKEVKGALETAKRTQGLLTKL